MNTHTGISAVRRACIAWSESAPFDSNARRHTSFASVDVLPEVDDTIDIVLRDEDLKRDVFRCGGPGGQHQNKTESGVRFTHLPTGIAAESRSERSQHKNGTYALALLKAKLIRMEEEKREAEYAKKYDEKGEVSFGNQIRSYVLQPYQIVKDLRTDHETGNPRAVLDGEIDGFIEAYLRMKLAKGGSRSGEEVIRDAHLNNSPDPVSIAMPSTEFWFDQVGSGSLVMRGPGIAVVFSSDRGLLGHAICIDSGSSAPASLHASWLVRTDDLGKQEMEAQGGRRVGNPAYQEIVPHELEHHGREGLCALLTGSCFDHHFSAVFSLFRDREMPQFIVLDVDVADRCRGPVEKLAATYVVSGLSLSPDARQNSTNSLCWRGSDASGAGLLELIAVPPASISEETPASVGSRVQVRAIVDPKIHTQRLCYRWRWASNSGLTR